MRSPRGRWLVAVLAVRVEAVALEEAPGVVLAVALEVLAEAALEVPVVEAEGPGALVAAQVVPAGQAGLEVREGPVAQAVALVPVRVPGLVRAAPGDGEEEAAAAAAVAGVVEAAAVAGAVELQRLLKST